MKWWEETGDELAEALVGHCDQLLSLNANRHRLDLRHARLYGGQEILGLLPWSYSVASILSNQALKLNVVASNVETAVSKLCKSKPAPQFLTNGADYEMRRKSEPLNKFAKGSMHQSGWYELDTVAMRDACVFGTAHIKHRAEGKVLIDERCLPWEILIDPRECRSNEPRTLVHRYFLDRDVAIARFAGKSRKAKASLEEAQVPNGQNRTPADVGIDQTCDQVEIIEGWHLRSSKKANDGVHAVAVRGVNGGWVMEEPWTRDSFPFSRLHWEPPVIGYWGRGIAEKLTGIQYEMNALLIKIQESMRIHGRTFAFIDAASAVPKSHIDNSLDAVFIVENGARPPTVVTNQSVHPELLNQVSTLYQRSFQEVGISEMSATSTKPSGLNSGKALRDYNDIGSERLVAHGRRRETFCLDGVRRRLELVRTIPGFEVDVPEKRTLERIAWKDVALKESEYVLQLFPASMLSQTPAARRQDVIEMQSAQWIDREKALELMDIPDLDDLYARVTATAKYVRKTVDSILDGEKAPPPDPRMRLDLALELANTLYLMARTEGAPEDALEELRRYLDQLTQKVNEAKAAASATPAQQAPPPPAAGAPTAAAA